LLHLKYARYAREIIGTRRADATFTHDLVLTGLDMTNGQVWTRHIVVMVPSLLLTSFFWFSRMEWDAEMRLWRAVGDSSWVLLCISLLMGPLARVWKPVARLVTWRREIGIWFGVLTLAHAFLILNGWVRWDSMRFLGYEFIPELGRLTRLEPGFGLSNALGLFALNWALLLTATSSTWAIKRLGNSAWKWLHSGAYIIFYLVTLHVFYFLFMHYTVSFHRSVPPNPNWLGTPFILLTLSVPILQAIAFIKTVSQRRNAVA
jgi:methionine sulfoxide reductase heme-binding subunit